MAPRFHKSRTIWLQPQRAHLSLDLNIETCQFKNSRSRLPCAQSKVRGVMSADHFTPPNSSAAWDRVIRARIRDCSISSFSPKWLSQRDLTIIVGSHIALRRHPSEIYILSLLAACLLVEQASSSLVRPTESLKKISWHLNHSFCSNDDF